MPEISIVIPAFNEQESMPELLRQIREAVQPLGRSYEVIVVDDGSTDNTLSVLRSLKKDYPELKVISFRRNYGKSAALSVGFREARGEYIFTLDADLQDDPGEIPEILPMLEGDYDLVSGWKKKRHDPLSKTVPSRIFNLVTSLLSGIRLHDFNCGLKGYRKEAAKSLEIYGELHRFLPVLAHWHGFRVGEKVVRHRPRKYGRSKFGLSRFFNGFFDLLTVIFITRYKTSPLHMFGMVGLFAFLFGFAVELYLTVRWFMGESIRNRPLFFLGILSIIVGVQVIFFGLLGEMISAGAAERTQYSVKEKIE